MNASMEWKLAFHETDSMLDYEIRNGLYMAIICIDNHDTNSTLAFSIRHLRRY